MLKNTHICRWLAISLVIVVVDLFTKYLVQGAFEYGEHLTITSFFDLVRYHNEGAAFSFLANAGGWQKWFFTAVSAIASVVMLYLIGKYQTEKLFCVALALVLGGALGNLYDRITLGYVVDFLFLHINHHYWPAFNVADSAICVGVVLLFIDSFKKPKS